MIGLRIFLLIVASADFLSAATITVVLGPGNAYVSNSITVNVGDTVHWDNSTASAGFHNVSPTVLDTEISPNAVGNPWTYDHTFNSPGSFAYFCQQHGAGMSGVVNVAPGGGPAATATATTATVQLFDKAPELLLAPNPLKVGNPVCLYSALSSVESHWDIYNTGLQRVAGLDFSGAGLQCWDTKSVAAGLYYVSVRWVLANAQVKRMKQKVVLWR